MGCAFGRSLPHNSIITLYSVDAWASDVIKNKSMTWTLQQQAAAGAEAQASKQQRGAEAKASKQQRGRRRRHLSSCGGGGTGIQAVAGGGRRHRHPSGSGRRHRHPSGSGGRAEAKAATTHTHKRQHRHPHTSGQEAAAGKRPRQQQRQPINDSNDNDNHHHYNPHPPFHVVVRTRSSNVVPPREHALVGHGQRGPVLNCTASTSHQPFFEPSGAGLLVDRL